MPIPSIPPRWKINSDGSISPIGDRSVKIAAALTAKTSAIDKPSTATLAAAEMLGHRVSNLGQSADALITLDPAAEGLSFTAILGTTAAFYYRFDPNASDKIIFDGTALTDGKYVGVASAVAGNAIHFEALETATGVYDWHAVTISGNWVAEA